jgi:hypothetical protein
MNAESLYEYFSIIKSKCNPVIEDERCYEVTLHTENEDHYLDNISIVFTSETKISVMGNDIYVEKKYDYLNSDGKKETEQDILIDPTDIVYICKA